MAVLPLTPIFACFLSIKNPVINKTTTTIVLLIKKKKTKEAKMVKVEKVDDRIINNLEKLIDSIVNKIPGEKIITLVIQGRENNPFVIDVSKDGKFGYHESHEVLFKTKLISAFLSSGGMIIRQFLPMKTTIKTPDGRKIKVPLKKIYGVFIAKGSWYPFPKEEVKKACCTDPKTGKPIPPEPGVIYSDFPV